MWIRVRGLPEEGRTPALLNMWEGGFAGQADFVECEALVATDEGRLRLGDTDFCVRWQKAAG
jgi:hypothetical protein